MNYYDRSLDALMHAYGRYNVTFDHGDGIHLYDVNQKEYIDFFSGIGVNSFGYNYPAYVEAMEKQLHRLMHISNYFNTVETIEAAECVKKATKLDKVFFTNSGAESTEGALKLARKYYYQKHGKADSEIISLNHSFHGRTTGSVKLTGNAHYQEAFGPLIEGVKYANINDLESVKALVNEKTAAIIVEPVQGEGGVYVCSKEFLTGLRILCDEKDIALILDEVQCGMGRTGTIMTYFQYDILPDILCLAKGIGAGFPMGAFVANKKFAAAMEPGDHGSTYGGNPMAGQACRTVFKILEETKMLDHVQDISEYLIEKLDDLKDKYDKEPIRVLSKFFILGILVSTLAIYAEEILIKTNIFTGKINIFYMSFIVAGVVEEGLKELVLIPNLLKEKSFNERLDGIIYSVFLSLGFATIENIIYILFEDQTSAFEVGVIRSIISVPAHMMFAVIMGYYISKYRFTSSKAKKRKYLTLSIVLPILLHGVFDFILMIQYRWSIIVFIVYIVYLWKSSLDKLDEYTNNSRKKFLKRYKFIRHKKRKDD